MFSRKHKFNDIRISYNEHKLRAPILKKGSRKWLNSILEGESRSLALSITGIS